ncbi:MAG: sulfite oxidase-like oxidoreductase [Sulfolobaceae archaeon]
MSLVPPGQRFIKRFIVYAEFGIPRVDINEYYLSIEGLVENSLKLTYDELKKLPQVKIKRDFHCVTGWSVASVEWEGIPFKELVKIVKVKPEAKWVVFTSLDGYTTIVPIDDVMVDDAIIALKMNGKELPLEHGFPARPIIPHLYGWKSAKWLNGIIFVKEYMDGYWEERGYHERGNVWEEERFKNSNSKHQKRRPVLM